MTDAEQFIRFCKYLNIKCSKVVGPEFLNSGRLEAVFETDEFSFDPLLIRRYYLDILQEHSVTKGFGQRVIKVDKQGEYWHLIIADSDGNQTEVQTKNVINATYANIDSVNKTFGFTGGQVFHEISELAMLHSPSFKGIGLTVMDGPYVSMMPYGCSGFHSLSSVLYTHHTVSWENSPTFACQSKREDCSPEFVRACTRCLYKPKSNIYKMLRQLKHYVSDDLVHFPHGSLFTVKTKLKSSFIDDARPTDISVLQKSPMYAVIFSGKINSIYEVESLDVSQ